MSDLRPIPPFAAALLLCLLLGGTLSLFSTAAPEAARPPAPPEVLEQHLQTLRAEFPEVVLPLERERLTASLLRAIELDDENEVLRLLQAGAHSNWTGVGSLHHSDTRTPLFVAIRHGNPRIVEALLEDGARAGGPTTADLIASRNQWSQTPLYFAVRTGNRQIVDLLLEHGALINGTNGYGKTPIVGAIEEGNLSLFNHLLSRGAVCDFETGFAVDRRPSTDVHYEYSPEYFVPPFEDRADTANGSLIKLAEMSGNQDLVTAVREQFKLSPAYGPDLRATSAARRGDVEELRRLLAEGYDPAQDRPGGDARGETLLHLAENGGHWEAADLLVQSGVSRREGSPKKNAVHLAIESGTVAELKAILESEVGSEPLEVRGTAGATIQASPLIVAVRAQRGEMVDFLLRRPEADAWLADPVVLLSSMPYYQNDRRSFSPDICKSLIEAGAAVGADSVDAEDPERNALLRAARAGWKDVYRSLEKRAPRLAHHDAALQAAASGNHTELARYLVAAGADPGFQNPGFPITAVEHAFVHRNRQLLELFMRVKGEIEYPDQYDVSGGYNHFEQYAHPLYHAALVGDTQFCEYLLRQFPPEAVWQELKYEPYEYDNYIRSFGKGSTPLFAAVYGDHAETLKLLLAYGLQAESEGRPHVDINALDANGSTVLHEAVRFRAGKCVQLLLAAGADPTRQDASLGRGDTPLHLPMDETNAAPASPNEAMEIFALLAAAALNGDDPNWARLRNSHGQTPLHRHAEATNTNICLKLIELGADVNAQADHGETALSEAIRGKNQWRIAGVESRRGRSDLARKLVEAGATFDKCSLTYCSSYYALAFQSGLFEFCRYLREKGVDPEIPANAGEYLCSAAKYQRVDLVKQLLAAGADVNARDAYENTALHWAIHVRDVELVKLLLQAGADPNLEGDDDRTALFAVFDRFLDHVAKFNTPDPRQTRTEALDVLRVLLQAGADPQFRNQQGRTVLDAYPNMPDEFRRLIETAGE